MSFKKAEAIELYARIALYAPTGGGKTVSSLRIAHGLGGSIAIIDSEHGSSAKAKRLSQINFDYDIWVLDKLGINNYTEAINAAAEARYQNLIIDSMSHAWYELLQENEALAQSKFKGNTWAAWSKSTPKQREFIEAIIRYPGNILATFRARTEWTQTEDRRPQRVGLAPIQGKEIEYEFDMLMTLTTDHSAYVEKDRTGRYQDKHISLITEELGQDLKLWLKEGKTIPKITQAQLEEINNLIGALDLTNDQVEAGYKNRGIYYITDATIEQAQDIIAGLKKKLESKTTASDQVS